MSNVLIMSEATRAMNPLLFVVIIVKQKSILCLEYRGLQPLAIVAERKSRHDLKDHEHPKKSDINDSLNEGHRSR